MNIGFFYGWRTYPVGVGASVHGYQLVKGLTEEGHELCVWNASEGDNPYYSYFRRRQLISFLRSIDLLYVRVDWSFRTTRWTLLKLLSIYQIPVVWEVNGPPWEMLYDGRPIELVEKTERKLRRYAKLVDAVIGASQQLTDHFASMGIPRAHLIPNGSDPDLFSPRQEGIDSLRPLCVVWIGDPESAWHNFDVIGQAAKLLPMANIRFKFFGDVDRFPTDLPSNVELCGTIPYLELSAALTGCDVGLNLFREIPDYGISGLSLKLFDYMASGLAILAKHGGEDAAILNNANAGVLTNGSPSDIAEKLTELEANRLRCKEFGSNARRAVIDHFNWKRAVKETSDVCISLHREHRGA